MVSIIQPPTLTFFHIISDYGDDCWISSISPHVNDIHHEITRKFPEISHIELSQEKRILEYHEVADTSKDIKIQYYLYGGSSMKCTTITNVPDALQIKVLCFKCGIKNFPIWTTDWLCDHMCCCVYHKFGIPELSTLQLLCLGPCVLGSNISTKLTTTIPDLLTVNILCWKCGIQNFPDWRKEDFIQEKWLCLHQAVGFPHCMTEFQFLCCHVACGNILSYTPLADCTS
mmetsp:Transcript_1633/g.2595  ORF Transcript_1633/g.2595 Transcript_1633/m.2595 type:complete len:229 (+) Transcript_1633:183-869(+)